MTMTDPIADMLTRIRNANVAMHDEVSMPCSKQKVALAKILEQEGYIAGFAVGAATDRAGRGADDQHEVLAPSGPARSRVCAGCPSPACGCTPRPTGCLGCSAASASPCCPPARGS